MYPSVLSAFRAFNEPFEGWVPYMYLDIKGLVTVGLAVGDPETAQAAAFPVLAPLVFASSAFVPVEKMPGCRLHSPRLPQPINYILRAIDSKRAFARVIDQHAGSHFTSP